VGKRSILIHKELHSKIECKECGQYFTETYLKRHRPRCLKIRKCAVEKATVKCEICGKVVGERGLKSHKELHNKVECTTCGEYFTETFLRLKHPKQCKLLLPFFKK
jgi:ribosomal protein S27E